MKRTGQSLLTSKATAISFLLSLTLLGLVAVRNGGRRPAARAASGTHTTLRQASAEASQATKTQLIESYGKLPLSFEANQGQTDPRVKFISRGNGYSLSLTSNEAVLALSGGQARSDAEAGKSASEPGSESRDLKATVLRMKFAGAKAQPQVSGEGELPGKVNYFIGSDPQKWRTNVPTFGRVRYRDVYPGIDLAWYGKQRQLEYDFIVAPGAAPDAISLEFEGAERIEVDARGDLVLHTDGGQIRQHRPIIYQEVSGVRQEIPGGYTLQGRNQVGFQVGAYDATAPLVIDPVLVYSTYLGGAFTVGEGIAVDPAGNAYLCSSTSAGLPTVGPFQGNFGGGPRDAFVAKLNAAGTALVHSTYLGGNDDEQGVGVALDASGNVYAVGITNSSNFPTKNAFQPTQGSASTHGFIAKLDPTKTGADQLVYSTYLGGNQGALASGIAVDSAGNAYATGSTTSTDFPLTAGAFQTAIRGNGDIFVIKLDSAGSSALYSTLLGGSERDINGRIAVDPSGNIYINGHTDSANFPTTANAFRPAHASDGGLRDAFVAKLNPAASGVGQLVYSTFLGGNGNDESYGLSLDSSGAVYVTGSTESTDFPGAALPGMVGGGHAVFLTKLNPSGSGDGSRIYSALLGGSGNDYGNAVAVDTAGNAYVTGFTESANFPTVNPAQQTLSGPMDAFVLKLNAAGSAIVYSTYLGGSLDDSGLGIAVDSDGNAFVTGQTRSQNFPTTPAAFQPANGGSNYNAFVVKLSPNRPPTAACQNVTLSAGAGCTANASIDNGSSDPDGGAVSVSQSPPGPYPLGTTSVTLTVTDNQGASSQCTATVTVVDDTRPFITACPTDKTLAANAGCQAVIPNLIPEVVASDNCTAPAGLTIIQSPAAGTSVGLGVTTVTVTVRDAANNTSACTARVTVADTTAPTITACAANKTLSASANCQVAIPDLTSEVSATDNCAAAQAGARHLMIPNALLNAIQEFDPVTRSVVRTLPLPSPYSFSDPPMLLTALVRAGDRSILVNARNSGGSPALLVLANDGQFVTAQVTGGGWLQQLVFDPRDQTQSTVLGGVPFITEIQAFNPFAGTVSIRITRPDANFIGIATDSLGQIYAGDHRAGQILLYDSTGVFQRVFANVGTATGSNEINAMTRDADGHVYVAQNSSNRIAKFTSTGAFATFLTSPSFNQAISAFFNPGDGLLYVGNFNDGRLITMTTSGVEVGVTNLGGRHLGVPGLISAPPALTITQTPAAGTMVGPGTHAVTLTVSDAAGNSSTCTATVTVIDVTLPTITAPPAVTVNADQNSCGAASVTLGTPTTSDNCSVASVTNDAPPSFPVGTTTVTWRVTDGAGNAATATQLVTVTDHQPPTITAPPTVTVNTDAGSCLASNVVLGAPTVGDNCAGAGPPTNNAPPVFPLGQTIVTWAIRDAAGNTATATQIVRVTDNQAPTITAPPSVSASTGTDATSCGAVVSDAALGTATANDTCGNATLTRTGVPAGNLFPVGTTILMWTATDGSGNTATSTQTVTVSDNTAPTVTCPATMTAAVNASCQAAVPNLLNSITVLDNCTPGETLVRTQNPAAGTLVGPGTHTITVTVTDGAGNSRTCATTLTVTNSPPANVSAGGPYVVDEGSSTSVTASGDDPEGGAVSFAWDLDDNGTFEAPGRSVTFSAAGLDGPINRTIRVQVSDNCGLSTTSQTTVTIRNVAPTASLPGSVINEGGSATLTFINQFDPSPADTQAGFRYSYDCNNDGVFETSDTPFSSSTCPYPENGLFTARGRIKDKDGGFTDYSLQVQVNNVPPAVGAITAPTDPLQVNSSISTGAYFSDIGVFDTHTAVWDWGDGSTSAGTVTEDNGSGSVGGSHIYTAVGVYTITLTVMDDDGGSALSVFKYVVLYDPSAGFVTGAGWIDSPSGAYVPSPMLTGRAHFGFVSRYRQGANRPDGQTRFEFRTANLDFRSTSYDWLVVAGARAQFKGSGTINGGGNYGFLLTAIDGQVNGGGGVDKFRIKIWDKANGDAVVYDNQMGADDNSNPTTALGGGSIVIHK
jgi:hypothetical protein